jgi:predicted phage terminase large subunit-like protein|nr:MAG TPA: Large Terminase [Caudoviricetes sp.]
MIYFDDIEFTDDNKYSIYLIDKYLKKYFPKNQNNIRKKYLPNEVAKVIGEKDITFFSLYFLRTTFVPSDDNSARELCEEHYKIWRVLSEAFVQDLYDKLNIVEPRGLAKSTICDKTLAIWLHCYKKSKFTLLGAKTADDAEQFLNSIKKEFLENELIKDVFGNLIDLKGKKPNSKDYYKVNSGEIEFTNDTYIRAVGSTTSVRGANWGGVRPTVVIADDYQSEVDVITEDAREKKWNRWCKEVEEVGDTAVFRKGKKVKAATKFVSIGTVLHIDCLISKLSRNRDYHTIINRAVLLEDGQTIDDIFESDLWLECKKIYFDDKIEDPQIQARKFYEKHIDEMKYPLLWEEKWDFFSDIAVKYWTNRKSFMSEKMNDASTLGVRWFKAIRTQAEEEIEDHTFLKTMLCVDPAGEQSRRSDFFAMAVGSLGENDFKYIRKMILAKMSYKQYCQTVIDLLKEYTDITHLYIEKNTYLGADVTTITEMIDKDYELKRRNIIILNEMSRKNKDERISTIIEEVNNGQLVFNNNNKDFTQQILDFQGTAYSPHDDAPDIIAELSRRLIEIEVKNIIRIMDRRKLGV